MDAELKQMFDELLELVRGGSGLSGGSYRESRPSEDPTAGTSKHFAQLNATLKRAQEAHNAFTHDIKENADELSKATELQSQQKTNLSALNKSFKEGKISADRYKQELQRLEREVEDLGEVMGDLNDESNKSLKKQIEKSKKDADAARKFDELTKSVNGLLTVSGSVKLAFSGLNAIGGATGKVVSSLQSNASGMEISSGIMTAGIDAAGSAGKMAGDTLTTVGGAMALTKGPIRNLGIAATIAGPLLSGFSDSLSKLAKFGVNVLQKEVEKTIKSFNDASSAGAMFSDGMTGMRNAAGDAGLTVEQFSGVLKSHSSVIASSGLGVSEGAKKIGAALKAGGNPMKDQLLNLGYSFEEQAGLVAETIQQMRGSNVGPLGASNAVIAEQTQKYAENLRVVTAITGEDAKKKSEAIKQQMSQLAFQQKLAQKSPEQQAAINRAMLNMSDMSRKNFMDMVNFGNVINKEGAAFNSVSAGMRAATLDSLEKFNNGTMDENTERANQAKNGEQIHKDMLDNTAIATAGAAGVGGLVGGLAEAMGKELQYRIAWTKEAQEAAEKGVSGQKNTTDELTAGVHSAAIAAQELAIGLQDTLTPAIAAYAKVAAEILDGVKKQVADLGLGGKDNQGPSLWDRVSSAGKGASKQGAIGAGIGMAGAGIATLATGGAAAPTIPVAGLVGLVSGGIAGGLEGWMNAEKGKAVGGIASGPTDGYLEKLHGTELIVPMVGGTINTSSQGYAELLKMLDKTSRPSTSVSTLSSISNNISSTNVLESDKKLGTSVNSEDISNNLNRSMTSRAEEIMASGNISDNLINSLSLRAEEIMASGNISNNLNRSMADEIIASSNISDNLNRSQAAAIMASSSIYSNLINEMSNEIMASSSISDNLNRSMADEIMASSSISDNLNRSMTSRAEAIMDSGNISDNLNRSMASRVDEISSIYSNLINEMSNEIMASNSISDNLNKSQAAVDLFNKSQSGEMMNRTVRSFDIEKSTTSMSSQLPEMFMKSIPTVINAMPLGNIVSELASIVTNNLPKASGPDNLSNISLSDVVGNIKEMINNVIPTEDKSTDITSTNTLMLAELRKIGEFISESLKSSEQTLYAQEKLVNLAGDQIRALDKLTRHVA